MWFEVHFFKCDLTVNPKDHHDDIKLLEGGYMMREIAYRYFNWGPYLFGSTINEDFRELILEEGEKVRGNQARLHVKMLAGHLDEEYRLPAMRIMEHLEEYVEAYRIGYQKWLGGNSHLPPRAELIDLWINYMKAGDFNPPHDHGGDLSFVIFPDIPDELIEENQNFTGTLQGPGGISWLYGEGGHLCISMVHQMPKTGDIYLFPASLKHFVLPFKSDITRISVSGNISLKS